MSDHEFGLGLFVRPPTERVPHPTSIAVDLGLRATAPQAGRPWACRVVASLMEPGRDGLAAHVADVERLAELGRALLERLGDGATCAAAVTGGGRRTWLLYVAGAEPGTDPGAELAAVTTAMRQAVRLAFAEQADYVPSVTVVADPAWAEYLALCPTPAEADDLRRRRDEAVAAATAKRATDAAVAGLTVAGVDLTRAVPVTYRLAFPTPAAGASFLARAVACQFRAAPVAADGTTVAVTRDAVVEAAGLHAVERWLVREAARVNGRYAGWSTPSTEARRRAA